MLQQTRAVSMCGPGPSRYGRRGSLIPFVKCLPLLWDALPCVLAKSACPWRFDCNGSRSANRIRPSLCP